jgi:hypothetical protein
MGDPPLRYSKPRVFVKGLESLTYSLTEMRRQRLAALTDRAESWTDLRSRSKRSEHSA